MPETPFLSTLGVQVAQFLLYLGATAIMGIWRLARVEADVMTKLDAKLILQQQDANREISAQREKHEAEMSGMRDHIKTVEIWARDEFVRSREFYPIVESIKSDIKILGDKLDAKMIRIEDKIDTLNQRQ